MSDDTVRLSLVGQVLRRRWRLLVVLAVLGALAGAGASFLLSPGYQTTSNVLLQGPRQADELLTEAQVATSSVVLDRAANGLSWQTTGAALQDKVSASVANGNVVTITAAADTAEHAQQLADKVAAEFVRYSSQLLSSTTDAAAQVQQEQREALRQQVALTNQRITEMAQQMGQDLTVESVQARTQIEGLRTALEQAVNNLNQADAAAGQANMAVLGTAERPSSPEAPTMAQLVAGGVLLFVLAGVLGHLFTARTDKRLRTELEIGAALGTDLLGSVDIPDERPAGASGWRAGLRWLVQADEPWNLPRLPVPADQLGAETRYRRVLNRLGPPGRRVLAVVADDDAAAHRVAIRLAAARGRGSLQIVHVSAVRPTVPEHGDGVLVVVTAGTRTAWELVGVAEACADAGQEVLGAVLTNPVRPGATIPAAPSQVGLGRDAMAGSA